MTNAFDRYKIRFFDEDLATADQELVSRCLHLLERVSFFLDLSKIPGYGQIAEDDDNALRIEWWGTKEDRKKCMVSLNLFPKKVGSLREDYIFHKLPCDSLGQLQNLDLYVLSGCLSVMVEDCV